MTKDLIVEELLSVFERRSHFEAIDDLINAMTQIGSDHSSATLVTLGSATEVEQDISRVTAVETGETPASMYCDNAILTETDNLNPDDVDLSNIAFGIDTNALIRIVQKRQGTNVSDYLDNHTAPVILPGQAVQEFWNNKGGAMNTMGNELNSGFENFKKVVNRIREENNFGQYIDDIQQLVKSFQSDYQNHYSQSSVNEVMKILKNLRNTAFVSFCPRTKFYPVALHRRETKTPPGFEDKRDGDFFIWLDFLYGLKRKQFQKENFDKVVFVTNETKKDWRSGRAAHPILVSEVKALFDVPFGIWDSDSFVRRIRSRTA